MPRTFRHFSLITMVTLAVGVSACGKKPPAATPAPAPPPAAPAPINNPPPAPPPVPTATPAPTTVPVPTEAEIFAKMTVTEINATKPLDDVFFEYDKAELSDRGRASLTKNAEWLRKWPSTKILIEGHADMRGTNEYNLALGERRAAALRDYLVSLSIDASRITIVSMGEEQPTCRDEAETCWSLNRRGHFLVTAK